MRWDVVVPAVVAALEADAALIAELGGENIEHMESNEAREIPSIRYTMIYDTEEEVMNPIGVQVDYWARNIEQAFVIEKRIRTVLSTPVRRVFGGIEMLTQYVDGRDMDDPQPGVVHRSLDFRFEPVKQR